MQWSDLKNDIGKAAPIVGTLLGGPAGAAVGGLISFALGTDNSPDAVNAALATDPDALVKIKELELNSKTQLQQLTVTAEQNRLADVQSARAMHTANPADHTAQYLAWGVTIGFFAALGCVMCVPLKQDVHDLLLVMIGALQTAWISVVSYYFGSSKEAANNVQSIKDVGMAAASAPVNIHQSQPSGIQVPLQSPQTVTVAPGASTDTPDSTDLPVPGQQGSIYQGS